MEAKELLATAINESLEFRIIGNSFAARLFSVWSVPLQREVLVSCEDSLDTNSLEVGPQFSVLYGPLRNS